MEIIRYVSKKMIEDLEGLNLSLKDFIGDSDIHRQSWIKTTPIKIIIPDIKDEE